jgi:DNA-binding transcriptional MerR regulator
MRDLMIITGLPKSTLLYYVEQGLLPAPVKTSPNMAYYDRSCVERAAFIRDMQTRHRLPLDKIRNLLGMRDQGQEVAPLVDLLHIVFGEPRELMDLKALCAASGLTPAQVKGLRQARLLLPLSEDGFDQQDLAAALNFAGGLSRGLTSGDLAFYPELGQQIVDREMALRQRLTRDLPLEQDAALTMGMVQVARATRAYVIDRLFQLKVASHRDLKNEGGDS